MLFRQDSVAGTAHEGGCKRCLNFASLQAPGSKVFADARAFDMFDARGVLNFFKELHDGHQHHDMVCDSAGFQLCDCIKQNTLLISWSWQRQWLKVL